MTTTLTSPPSPPPPTLQKFLSLIVQTFKGIPISNHFPHLKPDKIDPAKIVQRSLEVIGIYQPPQQFLIKVTRSNSTSLFDNPFLNKELRTIVTTPAGYHFLHSLLSTTDLIVTSNWIKNDVTLPPNTKDLCHNLLFLKAYLTYDYTPENEINLNKSEYLQNLPTHHKKAWQSQNLRYQLGKRSSTETGTSYHLLTIYMNEVLEERRLMNALKTASQPAVEPQILGRHLSTSIFTCVEFPSREFLSIYPRNLNFLARYGAVLPDTWYTPEFMEVLFTRFLVEVELTNAEGADIVVDTLRIFSYWARRTKDKPSEVNYVHRLLIITEEALSLALTTPRSPFLTTYHLDSLLKSCLIILTRFFGTVDNVDYADTVQAWTSRVLESEVILEIGESLATIKEDISLVDIIQATMVSILNAHPTNPHDLVRVYLQNQTSLCTLGHVAPELRFPEQNIRVFNLFNYFTNQMVFTTHTDSKQKVIKKFNRKLVRNPFSWSPFFTAPQETFLSNLELPEVKSSALLALGGSFLVFQKLSPEHQPSFHKELTDLFLDTVNAQLDKLPPTEPALTPRDRPDPSWDALAIVLGRCLDGDNYFLMLNHLSPNTTQFLTGFLTQLFRTYYPPTEELVPNYGLLSESPLFRETGRISKLIGRILSCHTEGNKIMKLFGARSFFGYLGSSEGPSYLSSQDRFAINLEGYERLYAFTVDFHAQWDQYLSAHPRDLSLSQLFDGKNSEGLRKCLRNVLFAYTIHAQTALQRLSTAPPPTDREIEIGVLAFSNLHFTLQAQTPRIMFSGHSDIVHKVFELVRGRPHLMNKLLKDLYPYSDSLPLPDHELLPETPLYPITFQSKELFYFWFIENLMPNLTGEQVESYVLPLLRPYLTHRQPWSLDHYESSHAIVLAMFKYIDHPVVSDFAKWYRVKLLEQYPEWLQTEQFRMAYLAMIEGLARQDSVGGHTVWTMIRHLADKITSTDHPTTPTVVPGYFQTFIKLLPNVPITYLPAFTHRIEELITTLTSPSGGSLGKEAAAKMAFDVVAREDLSLTHKSYAIPWYLDWVHRLLPHRRNLASTKSVS